MIRLGRGGGYYDKFFEAYKNEFKVLPFTIGVGFQCQLVDDNELIQLGLHDFPFEKHDFSLNELIV